MNESQHMIDDFSFWTVLTFARFALFFAAVFALAVWASRQPDQSSELVERLTGKRKKQAEEQRYICGPARGRDQRQVETT